MAKASNNQFPSVLFTEGTVPDGPAAGDQRVYIDTADHHLKRVDENDAVVDIEGNAAIDAGDVTYTPTTAADWDSDADPGDLDDALDQLAERVDDNEGAFASYLPLAGGTMSGELVAADQLVTRPEIKDYAETVNPIGGTGGGTQDIDLTAGNVVSATVDTGENTFTFSNPSATGKACSFTLILTNGGSQTVNWPASVDWAGGTAPTLTASGVDVLTFVTIDGGTVWYGFAAGLDMK